MADRVTDVDGEARRITKTYAQRKTTGKGQLYAWYQQSAQWEKYRLRSVAAAMFASLGWRDFSALEVCDIGCGAGGWLRTLMEWGVPGQHLHGIDLLEDRVAYARSLAPQMDIQQASGWAIPFPDARMDLVSAHTVFSSITDGSARALLAREMARVTKPGGVIMLYDFRIADPRNRDTVGISAAEVKRLFPDFSMRVRSLTLSPPISRRLVTISPFMVALGEWLFPFLRTHRLFLLTKPD